MLLVLKPCTLLFFVVVVFVFSLFLLVWTLLLLLLSGIFSCFQLLDAWMPLIHRKVLFLPFSCNSKIVLDIILCFGGF